MFVEVAREAERVAEEAALAVCWAQWVGLGSLAAPVGSRRPRSIVDPEALLLLSLYVSEREQRLVDMVGWWARTGSRLTSLQRMRTVADRFPDSVLEGSLARFAALATEAGDRRWRRLARKEVDARPRPEKGPEELKFIEPCALWPRLRAGLGVGAKADALTFLLGLRGGWASIKVVSYATGYSSVAVRNATGEMALARLIRATAGRPAEYLAPPGPWGALLEFHSRDDGPVTDGELPAWRFWSEVFAFFAHVIQWSRVAGAQEGSPDRVLASRARDLVEAHSTAFKLNNIPVPPPAAFKGISAAEGLLETVRRVGEWAVAKL